MHTAHIMLGTCDGDPQVTGINSLFQTTLDASDNAASASVVFTNVVDFDQAYGHRCDVAGYARGLKTFDALMPQLLQTFGDRDLQVLRADHGNDPTWSGADHAREYIPLVAFGPGVCAGTIGCRATFADIGQRVAHWLGIGTLDCGENYL